MRLAPAPLVWPPSDRVGAIQPRCPWRRGLHATQEKGPETAGMWPHRGGPVQPPECEVPSPFGRAAGSGRDGSPTDTPWVAAALPAPLLSGKEHRCFSARTMSSQPCHLNPASAQPTPWRGAGRPCVGARVTSPRGQVSRAEWPQPCLTPLWSPEIPTHTAKSPSSLKPQSYQLRSDSSFLGKVSSSRSHIFGDNCRYTGCCKGNTGRVFHNCGTLSKP